MAIHSWQLNIDRADALFNQLTDDQLMDRIRPGRNRGIYLLGHLTAVHDGMLEILGLGDRKYPQLNAIFLANPEKAGLEMPSLNALREYWKETNNSLAKHFKNMSPGSWFERHINISEEDFLKEPHRNKLNVLLSRTNHLSYHLGQLILLRD
jgi:hypothetical protein